MRAREREQLLEEKGVTLAVKSGFVASRLAKELGVTVRQLERDARRLDGRNLREWLFERRMIYARCLLLSGLSVKTVAAELGFAHVPSFCRSFKRHFGLTPRQFRRRLPELGQPVAKKPPNVV